VTSKKTVVSICAALTLVAAAAIGTFFYKSHHKGGTSIEAVSLQSQDGRELASSIMDSVYGKTSFNKQQQCWEIRDSNRALFCMKPVNLDKVDLGNETRLYLAASGVSDEGTDDGYGAIGLLILNEKNKKIIAAEKVIMVPSTNSAGPNNLTLVELSSTGYFGWMASVNYDGQPGDYSSTMILAPKGKNIIDLVDGFPPSFKSEDGHISYVFNIDDSAKNARVYPLLIEEKDLISGKTSRYTAGFDEKQWQYSCEYGACLDKNRPVQEQAEPNENSYPKNANQALFDGEEKLSNADLQEIMDALEVKYVIKDNENRGFVTKDCDEMFSLSGKLNQGNENTADELWVSGGNTCTSGVTGNSVWLFIRDEKGHFRKNLGFPASEVVVTGEAYNGHYDLRVRGRGFCEAVWRWNGKEYEHNRNVATQPGGCDGK